MNIFETLCREFRAVTGRGAEPEPARVLSTARVLYGDGVQLPRRETVPMSPELGAWLQSCGVIRSDGTFCIKQALLELSDFKTVIGEVALVYDALTSGTISKVHTRHKHVTSRVLELQELSTQEAVTEATDELRAELSGLRDTLAQVEAAYDDFAEAEEPYCDAMSRVGVALGKENAVAPDAEEPVLAGAIA